MKDKLFDPEISPKCEYCETGRASADGETVLCPKRGIVARDYCCRKFKYDIMKRIPKKRLRMQNYSEDDFRL